MSSMKRLMVVHIGGVEGILKHPICPSRIHYAVKAAREPFQVGTALADHLISVLAAGLAPAGYLRGGLEHLTDIITAGYTHSEMAALGSRGINPIILRHMNCPIIWGQFYIRPDGEIGRMVARVHDGLTPDFKLLLDFFGIVLPVVTTVPVQSPPTVKTATLEPPAATYTASASSPLLRAIGAAKAPRIGLITVID